MVQNISPLTRSVSPLLRLTKSQLSTKLSLAQKNHLAPPTLSKIGSLQLGLVLNVDFDYDWISKYEQSKYIFDKRIHNLKLSQP